MQRFLRIIQGQDYQDIPLPDEGKLSIGRSDEADIQIVSGQISRIHAQFVINPKECIILDKGSANGTLVNGQLAHSKVLKHGDQIVIGDALLQFHNPSQKSQNKPIQAKSTDSKTKVFAATKVLANTVRPKSLLPFFLLSLSVFLSTAMLIVYTFLNSSMQKSFQEQNKKQVEFYAQLLAEKNKNHLFQKNELLIDTEFIRNQANVQEAMIIDIQKKVLSPLKYRNHLDKDPIVQEALQSKYDKPKTLTLQKKKTMRIAFPIRRFNQSSKQFETLGAAKVIASFNLNNQQKQSLNKIRNLIVFIAFIIIILSSLFFTRFFSAPIHKLAEMIHKWRLGEHYAMGKEPFKEWAPLYKAIEQAINEKN